MSNLGDGGDSGDVGLASGYWTNLAEDYVTAWRNVFAETPSKSAVLLAMAVAEHETNNGRAWPGSFNFGGVQLRRLTPEENDAYDVGSLAVGATLAGDPGGILRLDTTPTIAGPRTYPVWFAAFRTQVSGIAYFLKILVKARSGCRAVLHEPDPSEHDLAQAMYLTGYFEGFVPGARPVTHRSLPLTAPEQQNVQAYTHAIERAFGAISPNLANWMPSNAPVPRISVTIPVPPFDLASIKGYQAALTFLAVKLGHAEFDPQGVDGVHGERTDRAVKAFQKYAQLTVDGDVGFDTQAKLEDALKMAGVGP